MEKLKIAVVGLGNRGQLFAEYVLGSSDAALVAIADCSASARGKAQNEYKLTPQSCYESADDFFAQEKCADAVFICTQDSDHKAHTIKAMQLGYDVCLEKPIATTMQDCEDIYAAQQATGRKVMICHVLRYSHFYGKLRQIIKSGEIGEVVTISQTENVAYWHDAHSYVRGVWSNVEKSSPMILAKCCHDLDILSWLFGKRCKSVSSFGELYYFKKENAPKGATSYCVDCDSDTRKDCPYDAFKIYNDIYKTYNPILGNATVFRTSRKDYIDNMLSKKPNVYGKCVFACDNNVVDHQVVNMLFEDDRTAQLTMTAFSKDCHRNIKIHGTLGEIKGDMEENKIYVYPFRADDHVIDLTELADDFSVHGGGDKLLFEDFIAYLRGNESSETRTTLKDSLLSHKMSFAAEYSCLHGGIPVKIEE